MLGLFVGVALIASKLARPLASVLGRPFARIGGVSGALARENAMRNPARTASTAAALMIGLALVTMVATLGKGLIDSDKGALRHQVQADYVVTSKDGWDPLSRKAGDAAAAAPGVTVASSVRNEQAVGKATSCASTGSTRATIAAVYHYDWVQGSDATLASLGRDGAIVRQKWSKSTRRRRRPDHGRQPGRPEGALRRPRDLHPAEVRADRPGARLDRDLAAGVRRRLRPPPERVHVPERDAAASPKTTAALELSLLGVPGREGRDQERLGRQAGEGRRTSCSTCSTSCSPSRSWSACSAW